MSKTYTADEALAIMDAIIGRDEAYDFPTSCRPAPKPTAKGMTDDQIDAAWNAHLKSRSGE